MEKLRRRGRRLMGVACPILMMVGSGCATLPVTPVEHAHFRDLGEVDGERLDRAVEGVLVEERGFTLARRSRQFSSVYYETGWQERDPFDEETARGITGARSRVMLRARRTATGAYRATLEAENQVRTDSLPSWHSVPVGPSFQEWVDAMVGALEGRLDSR